MKKTGIFMIILLTLLSFNNVPDRIISGVVTSSDDGSPLPGINVLLKGTNKGTTTNAEGKYSITVPSTGGVLVFSFVGYQSVEKPIGSNSIINVKLSPETMSLQEVVTTGHKARKAHGAVKRERHEAEIHQAPAAFITTM